MTVERKGSLDSNKNAIEKEFNYEIILEHVGQMGRFQWYVFLLLCWPILIMSMTVSSLMLVTGIPEYRCYVPGCDTSEESLYSSPWLNTTIPTEETSSGKVRTSRCSRYNATWENQAQCYELPPNLNDTLRCSAWVYDKSTFNSTIVTEYDLTCQNEWVVPIVQALFMVGMLAGASIFGPIADRLGRKPAFMIAVLWMSLFCIGSTFAPNGWSYGVLRFVTGLGSVGTFIVTYVWGIEHVGPRYFVLCGFIFQCLGPISGVIVTGVGYASRDWKVIQLVASVPALLSLIYWWLIPESPRWLLSKGKYKEAKEIIDKIAKFNKKQIPDFILSTLDAKIQSKDVSILDKTEPKNSENFSEIFKLPTLRKRLFIMLLAWIATEMGYFGLSVTSTLLAGDFYLNFLLTMVIEIPSYFIGIYIMMIIGRRLTLSCALLVCGVSCLVAGLVPAENEEVVTAFSLIAKFGAAIVLATVYSFTSELFPTANRSAAVGICATFGRIGAVAAPIIAITGRLAFIGLPFIIFGVVDVVAGFVALLLPETQGRSLPTTMEEAKELDSNKFRWRGFWPREK